MDRPIPTNLAAITPAWLTDALTSSGTIDDATTVNMIDSVVLGTGEGFAGDLSRLSVTYSGGDGPATMVAKVPTSIDDNRNGSEMMGVYEREIRMYQEVLPALSVPVPALYFADVDPNPDLDKQLAGIEKLERLPVWIVRIVVWLLQRFMKPEPRASVLILEDLAPSEIGDQVAGAELSRIASVLELAAEFHAATWEAKSPAGGPWLQSGGSAPKIFHASFMGWHRAFLKGDGRAVSGHMRELLDRVRSDGIQRIHRLHESAPQCLVHGDLRLDNMFFDDDEVRALIDWQLTRRGPAAVDVAYFIAGSVDPSVEESAVDSLLEGYHRSLVAAGIDDYAYEQFLIDYDDALLMVLASVTAVEVLDMGDDRGRDLVNCMVDRLDARLGRIKP